MSVVPPNPSLAHIPISPGGLLVLQPPNPRQSQPEPDSNSPPRSTQLPKPKPVPCSSVKLPTSSSKKPKRSTPVSRSRAWCLTWHYTDLALATAAFEGLKDTKYWIYGVESGKENTPHLQGFIQFVSTKSFKRVKALFDPKVHWEIAKGSSAQAADYCKKEGNFKEHGKPPITNVQKGEAEKERWRAAIQLAELGDDCQSLKEEEPALYVRHHSTFHKLASRVQQRCLPDDDPDLRWYWGETGTGKTRSVNAEFPDCFDKGLNKWWCGYAPLANPGHMTVFIDEWAPKHECLSSFIKKWADHGPFNAEVKGGSLGRIRPHRIIVCSNYSIDECFPDPRDSEPLKRRFDVTHFTEPFNKKQKLATASTTPCENDHQEPEENQFGWGTS